MTPETFAAERNRLLTASDRAIHDAVQAGLSAYARGEDDWRDGIVTATVQIWMETFQGEAPGANYRGALRRFRERTADVLAFTGKPNGEPDSVQVNRIIHWLSAYSVNDGTAAGAAARGIRYKRWVTMEDADVRGAHRAIDGEVRPLGGTFDVAGTKLAYPGEPRGPLEAWINCRCMLMPASREGEAMSANTFVMPQGFEVQDDLANPDGTPYTGALVVLVPAESDPVVAVSSEPAHLTFVWMGELADIDEAAQSAIAGEVHSYANALDGPVVVPVMKRDTLGKDDADVAMLERTDALVNLRDGLMESSPRLTTAHDAAKQFPEWHPHVTLGYPDRPAKAEYDADSVTFDRISLWLGGEHYDYPMGGAMAADAAVDDIDTVDEDLPTGDDAVPEDDIDEIPVHGVLAPEGVETGDGRGFREGALSARTLPVPLRYEVIGSHGGNQTSEVVTVGRVDKAWRDDASKMWRYQGVVIMSKPYADQALAGIVDGSGMGVSIDADQMSLDMSSMTEDEFEKAAADGRQPTQWFSSARVAGLTIVPIPAFEQAYIGLGDEFAEDMSEDDRMQAAAVLAACGCGSTSTEDDPAYLAAVEADPDLDVPFRDIPADERKRMADAGAAMPDGSYPIANIDDLKNAIQAVGRAKNPAAVKAHIKKRAKALNAVGLIPDGWSVAADIFAPGTHDGPGWITHPRATQRIRNYWVRGKGAAKIRWGVPGDFNRCRRQLAKYVQNPEWLAGLCANMHKEAIKLWPGQETGRGRHALLASGKVAAPILTLVADAGTVYPSGFFTDPGFTDVTPMHVDKSTGHVYGHLATWGTCHVGVAGACREAPHSESGYAYMLRGVVDTDAGEQRVASLTTGIGHDSPTSRMAAATAFYDNPDATWAYVNIGEDQFGIWYNGVVSPMATEATIDEVRAVGAVSGDWRPVGRSLELIGVVSVYSPGFPIRALAASAGVQTALIGAGVVPPAAVQASADADADANEEFLARAVVRAVKMMEDDKHAHAVHERALSLRAESVRNQLSGRI